MSVQEAHESVYGVFLRIVIVPLPLRVTIGAVVSRVVVIVPVAVFPVVSVIDMLGLLERSVPIQVTIPVASAGAGEQVRPGRVTVAPDSVPVQVTVVAPLVVDGDAVHVGTTGAVVSTTLITKFLS